MKNVKLIIGALCMILLVSCEIVQETKFKTDGSGTYSLGFDLSEMMKMGSGLESKKENKQIDTVIVFAELLNTKKDSIAKLTKEQQEKLKNLEHFSLNIKTDTVSKKFKMKINYDFKDVAELKLFSEKLKDQDIKELELLTNKTKSLKSGGKSKLPDFNKSYNTVFNNKKFSVKLTKQGLKEAKKNKDTTLTKNNPMADLVKFKSIYYFPHKIKKISNKNARILSDFKGIEITGNLYDINNNPKLFDVDIEFEKQ